MIHIWIMAFKSVPDSVYWQSSDGVAGSLPGLSPKETFLPSSDDLIRPYPLPGFKNQFINSNPTLYFVLTLNKKFYKPGSKEDRVYDPHRLIDGQAVLQVAIQTTIHNALRWAKYKIKYSLDVNKRNIKNMIKLTWKTHVIRKNIPFLTKSIVWFKI